MTKTYDNDIELINDTLAKAIKSGLIDFAQSLYDNYKSMISPSCHELKMTLYDAIRDNETDKIAFALKIKIPFEASLFCTAIEDATLPVFELIYNAYPDEFQNVTYLHAGETANYTAYAMHKGRKDIAAFLISKGIALNEDNFTPHDILSGLRERDEDKIKTAKLALLQPFAATFTADALPKDNSYIGESLTYALIRHDEELLDIIAKTPMFTEVFFSQNSINAAYYYGYTAYVAYYKKTQGQLPKPTRDPIKGLFNENSRTGNIHSFIGDPDAFTQALYIAGPKIERYEASQLLNNALKAQCAASIALICQQTCLFAKEHEKYSVSDLLDMLIQTPVADNIIRTTLTAISESALSLIDAKTITEAWGNVYQRISKDKGIEQITILPLLTIWQDITHKDGSEDTLKSMALTAVSQAFKQGGNPSNAAIKQIAYDLRTLKSNVVGKDNNTSVLLHDWVQSHSHLEGKSPKQCLAALRTAYYGETKRNFYIAMTLLAMADERQKIAYLDAFAGKELTNDVAFLTACHVWDETPMDMLSRPIVKGAKSAIMKIMGN